MVQITKNGCHITYGVKEFVLDNESDVSKLPVEGCTMGSTAFIIETGNVYMLNGQKEWVKI